ncbi:hypothetical protein BB560_004998 [Smittium megazygosporum]|uniref:Transcription elongation factor 1 homolog n=1 Tax=Smittium megazygosporum TaxID=133381 RepID=A0A2T9Z7P8_9FUNG|nr:hypothetical protein BB560_004998 [Smittium megazygosporum]
MCNLSFEAPINKLSMPIDVYSEWIDASERAQSQNQDGLSPTVEPELDEDKYKNSSRQRSPRADYDEEYNSDSSRGYIQRSNSARAIDNLSDSNPGDDGLVDRYAEDESLFSDHEEFEKSSKRSRIESSEEDY